MKQRQQHTNTLYVFVVINPDNKFFLHNPSTSHSTVTRRFYYTIVPRTIDISVLIYRKNVPFTENYVVSKRTDHGNF